jgi:hypothetical protein
MERLYNDATTPVAHGAGDLGGAGHGHSEPVDAEKHAN